MIMMILRYLRLRIDVGIDVLVVGLSRVVCWLWDYRVSCVGCGIIACIFCFDDVNTNYIMNIIDIGAGKYKKYELWLSAYPRLRIYAFEPHPGNFVKLMKMKGAMNDSSSGRLLLFNKAISGKKGKRPFYVCRDANSSSLLPFVRKNIYKWNYPMGHREFKTIKTIECEVLTLREVLECHNIRQIELLNVDTQGDSLDVLSTLTSLQCGWIKRILVKVHVEIGFDVYKGQCYSYDVARFLKRRYFQLFDRMSYSRGQEEILEFINEPMKNRKSMMYNLNV